MDGGFLRRQGKELALQPKPLAVLTYLVEHHGRLVTKAALIEAVWPDTAVTDNSLARCLLEIRRTLSDDSQRMIRTVARRGYVFAVPVTTAVGEPPLPAADDSAESGPLVTRLDPAATKPVRRYFVALATLAFLAISIGAMLVWWRNRPLYPKSLTYTQITNFTDSVTAPALSPDGRMVAFLRSDDWFLTNDQIYVKMLPDGEPVQLTDDARSKCCLAFSPDGSRIAFTTAEPGPLGWKTYTVSVLGGKPNLFLANASGLTWLEQRKVLFSELGSGVHMGIVTAAENRSEYRKIYFPQHERSMAHLSYASPDRKWALVLEMNPVWQPCRLIPLDGSSGGRLVGPQGKCTSAAWSPDGKWMYFGADVGGNHLWRQRFPNGKPDQITFGASEEEGIAMSPDGSSLITSIGTYESAVWIHDSRGDRPLSSEGHVAPMRIPPFSSIRFSSDSKELFYLIRPDSPASPSELWRADLESGRSEPVLRGPSIGEFDISSDGSEAVFSTYPSGKPSQLWLARLDRSSPPKLVASSGESSPFFGPAGQLLFQLTDGAANYLAQMNMSGSGRSKVVPHKIGAIRNISPDRRWVVAGLPLPDSSMGSTVAISIERGDPKPICAGYCPVAWAPDGKFFYVGLIPSSRSSSGRTAVIPVPPGKMLPNLPELGILNPDDAVALPGARLIDAWQISPGPDPSVYAFTKVTRHRNLFRILLREQ